MSQATMFLGNVDFPAARIALNDNFEALATLSSGATAPSTTFSGMLWHDTTANVLKLRNDSDTAWISLFAIDQGGGLAKPSTPDVLDEDDFASNSATLPPSQQSAKAYVDGSAIGVGQTWQDFIGSRAHSTSYQNTTGRPIQVAISHFTDFSNRVIQVSPDNNNWIDIHRISGSGTITGTQFIVSDGWFYRVDGSVNIADWSELR